MEATKKKYQFVLVHGACHGAWCWYKLKPLLEACGHRVTAIDLAASGINPKSIKELKSLAEYSDPVVKLVSSLPANEKVILVGHSSGGLTLALLMEKFPKKVLIGVFLSAFMPDVVNNPSYVAEKLLGSMPPEAWMDSKLEPFGTPEEPLTSLFFGFEFLKQKLYQLCSIQDYTLATTLVRTSSLFLEQLAKQPNFSSEGYGSVKRVFVVCDEDLAIPIEHQRWMIENSGLENVKEIKGVDHMAMLSKPSCISTIGPINITVALQMEIICSREKQPLTRISFEISQNFISSIIMMQTWLAQKLTQSINSIGNVRS